MLIKQKKQNKQFMQKSLVIFDQQQWDICSTMNDTLKVSKTFGWLQEQLLPDGLLSEKEGQFHAILKLGQVKFKQFQKEKEQVISASRNIDYANRFAAVDLFDRDSPFI